MELGVAVSDRGGGPPPERGRRAGSVARRAGRSWECVKEVFAAAAELPPGERREMLDRECAGDPSLRTEVESLLAADDRAGRLVEGIVAGAARGFVGGVAADPDGFPGRSRRNPDGS